MANDLREVARASGVSISTASRALAGSTLVSDATRARVEEAARRIGYRPNASARALRTGGSRLVGLVITNLVNNSFRVIAEIVQQRLAEAGHHLVLSITGGDAESERAALHTLMELGASGVVAVGSDSKAFAEVKAGAMPVVHLGRRPAKLVGDCVLGDEGAGAGSAVELLIKNGHRRIGIVCGPASVTSGRERLDGYRQALLAAGRPAPEELVVAGSFTARTGVEAVDALLALPRARRPTALLVANHESAYGVLPRLRELGVAIPEAMSVICYEDAPIMHWWWPPITVVDNQPAQMAELVTQLLMDRITGVRASTTRSAVHRIPTRLVERGSVAAVPSRAPGR
ncbi:LacI family transcriptional regulator [Nakamurella sp. UYEF19]|uniref:LacI family DNA-binding transcriptional regulator n=1 Tax=Nakamurella sp. UYEF19 TaxID=1756392 RepID=UPI0033998D53